MTRDEILTSVVLDVGVVGLPMDVGLDALGDAPYLLVEKNVGSAAAEQSHWFSTHGSLKAAAEYHASQEYREDWQVVMCVDLLTGTRFKGEEHVEIRWEQVA